MLVIDKKVIEQNSELLKCRLNYPVIKEQECENNIISTINESIYEDILSFNNVLNYEINNNLFDLDEGVILHVLSEYRVTFNKNQIISIPIEFSQLLGLYDISYINCYNYDVALGREITLGDIFDENINYLDILQNNLKETIKSIYEEEEYFEEYDQDYFESYFENNNEDIFDYDEQTFYIVDDGIVVCYCSYEISGEISRCIETKLLFSDYLKCLNRYTLDNILG